MAGSTRLVGAPDAFTLLAFLVTSAELCLTEPYDYGVFRLIDGASRLAAAMLPAAEDADHEFLASFLAEVDAGKMGDTRDRERYGAFLRGLSRRVAEHLVAPADAATVATGAALAPEPAPAAAPAPAPPSPPATAATPTATPTAVPTAVPASTAEPAAVPLSDDARAVFETIRARRVTRTFDPRPVSDDALVLVLEAARWATSGGGRRIHPFLVVRDRVTVARIRAVAPGTFSSPPVIVVVCTDRERAAADLVQADDRTAMIDVGTAAMNMMVAAQALGFGACPVTSFSRTAMQVVLGLPPTVEPELLLLLGHPAGPRWAPKPRPMGAAALSEGLVWWERPGVTSPGGSAPD